MSKEYYKRCLRAGRYRKVAIYTRPLPGDSPNVRASKQAKSNAVQRYFNNLSCEERLLWALCANFDRKSAAFVTLTFRDDALPESRAATRELVKKWVRKTRTVYRRRGDDFPSIYTIEGQPQRELAQADSAWETAPWADGHRWAALEPENEISLVEKSTRLHAHAFLLLPSVEDRALIRSFWPWGKVHISYIRVNDFESFRRLAAYVTKESRLGIRPANERSYTPSLGLAKPVIDGRWCDADESIALPRGAEELHSGARHDSATNSHAEWITYRFPRENPAAPKPAASKGRIFKGAKSAKTK